MWVAALFALQVALAVSASAASLHGVLLDSLHRFNDTDTLTNQLRTVLAASREQVRKHVAGDGDAEAVELAQYLHANHSDKGMTGVLRGTRASLGLIDRLAVSDPVLAVLARRTVLACIVLQWILLGQKPFDSDVEQHLAEITTELYGTHIRSVARRGLLEYLHISKSGGTSFSSAAGLSQCNMTAGIGQLDSLDDLPRWINATAFEQLTDGNSIMWSSYGQVGRLSVSQGCRERFDHISYHGYNYVSNEYTLHGGFKNMHKTHVCPQVVNVVTLREPESRLQSHLHYMLARMKKRLRVNGEPQYDMFHQLFCTSNLSVWQSVAPPVVDNYITRSLLGEHGFHTPVGDLGEDHVAVARKVLLQFDLVVDLDAGSEAGDLVMSQGLGWTATLAQVHMRAASHSFSKLNYSKEECTNEAMVQELGRRQGPDKELYSIGRALAFLDCLHLAMARSLGLQPKAPTPANDTSVEQAASSGTRCGLLSSSRLDLARPAGPAGVGVERDE